MNLQEILLQKASKKEIGHFYILESSAPEDKCPEILLQFVTKFIKDYYEKIEGQKQNFSILMDNPDVLLLGSSLNEKDHSDKPYKVEEAQVLGRFFEFKPVQGKRKFCVILDAHRLSAVVSNKWLKIFEEPQGESTIFLLNPRRTQLLPTIHSRAVHLRLPSENHETDFSLWSDFVAKIKEMKISQIIDQFSKGEKSLSYWVNELIRWESTQNDEALAKKELAEWLKTYHEMELFNQPTATKWALFLSHLKSNVFPRLNQ
jgi:hypothetical protein